MGANHKQANLESAYRLRITWWINLLQHYINQRLSRLQVSYYNATNENQDFRFGPTPAYLVGQNSSSIRNQRDFLRNRRDFIYVTIGLAYLLNVVDAYVYAHLRPFDVSDNLSVAPTINVETTNASIATLDLIPVMSFKFSIK